MDFRTDRHNNPTAFTTDMAKQAGLKLDIDYDYGDEFVVGKKKYYTARLLREPVWLTIEVINKLGFYTKSGAQRWSYIAMPKFIWDTANHRRIIEFMYQREGGTKLKALFK